MKILALSDRTDPFLYDYYSPGRLDDYDLILSCGDLPAKYLEFIVTVANRPLLYVPGNHDSEYQDNPPEGCVDIDGSVYDFHGLRIAGLGGSMKYNQSPYMYTEQQMRKRIRKMESALRIAEAVDILLTHAPAYGYGDLDDLPHTGFDCFNDFMNRYHPKYLLHGHVHKEYGNFERRMVHPSGTVILNCYQKLELEMEPEPFTPKHPFLYSRYILRD